MTKTWEKVGDLPRSETDDVEAMLQLKLDKDDSLLFGTTSNGFVLWDLGVEEEEGREKIADGAVVLRLPYGTRNITTKMLQSNSITVSAHRNYAIAGVRYDGGTTVVS